MPCSAPRQAGQLRRPATHIPTVCVVDPKADDYRGWLAFSEGNGVLLQIVASAEEALRLARTTAIDLWVINTELPGLSGYELCSMLKDRQPSAAIYLMANEYTPAVERQALRHRATLFGCRGGHIEWLRQWLLQRDSTSTPSPLDVGVEAR